MSDFNQEGSGLTVKEVQAEFDKLRVLRDKRTAQKSAFTKADRAWHQQMAKVREIAEADGITGGLNTSKGAYEVPEATWYATFQDYGAFQKWAEKENPSLLRYDHHVSAQLNDLARQSIEDGTPLPPGLGAYPKAVVKVKKAKR